MADETELCAELSDLKTEKELLQARIADLETELEQAELARQDMQHEREMYHDELEQVKAERDRLRTFAKHKSVCKILEPWGAGDIPKKCSCGLLADLGEKGSE